MELIIKNTRLAFGQGIYEKQAVGDGKPAYGGKHIIDPADAGVVKALDDCLAKVAEEKWPGKGAAILKGLIEDKKVCFMKGPYKNKNGEPYDGFDGMYVLSTRNEKLKPTVKDRFNRDVSDGDPGAPYNGSYTHIAVDIWAQDNQFGRRVNASLQGVMFASDGDSFSGGRPATDATFGSLAAEVGAEDFV